MDAGLVVPTLAAGPFRLRPFAMTDLDLIREASQDPYIPLITTVPVAFTDEQGRRFIERQWDRARHGTGYSFAIAEAAGFRKEGLLRSWQEVGGERKDMFMYSLLPAEVGRPARLTQEE
jgi:[ribosomal protein S5]-alanine N-acetyltransferase